MPNFFKQQLEKIKPYTATTLPAEKISTGRLFPERVSMLKTFKKNGICVEVGTQTGHFAKCIFNELKPEQLHIIDVDYSLFDWEYFQEYIDSGQVIIHEGDSSTILSNFPDKYFDFIYIDGDHTYEGVKKDADAAIKKVVQGGVIVFNDYTVFSPLENFFYGIPKVVNDLLIHNNYIVEGFAFHNMGYHDIALRNLD